MNNKKFIAAIAAGALALGCTIGGTVAWLTANSQTITNKFTTSDINVTLAETTGTEYQMIPGWTITKDPEATVKAGSVDCYLFVKLDKSAGFDTYMTYEMASGWTALTDDDPTDDVDVTGVYYRTVDAADTDQTFDVIANDTITVSGNITKKQMNDLKGSEPTLTVTAYASQLKSSNDASFSAYAAWKNI